MSERGLTPERFGEALASALGSGPGRNTLAAQRAALFAAAERFERPRGASNLSLWAGGGLAAAAAAVALVVTLGRHTPLQASFDGHAALTATDLWAHGTQPQALEFSDGSEVVLAPQTHAMISGIARGRADLELNDGHIVASITKNTGTTWTIAVGPYAVRVVGTHFSVDWRRESKTLKVEVSEGRVRVSGGDLPASGVALDAGAELERHYGGSASAPDTKAPEASPTVAASEPSGSALSAEAPTSHAAPEAAPKPSSASESAAVNGAPRPDTEGASDERSFLSLASKGRYAAAMQAAEKRGFSELANTLGENDLLTLANTARFSGNSGAARLALTRLRQRFPGRPGAELASLYLARVAEDLDKQPSEAVRWLRVFLQESPTGDLAAGARANLMGLLLKMGDSSGARGVAEDYLRYHPNGPEAAEARALVQARPR